MEASDVERMVARLERSSAASPRLYKAKVGLLALAGFALLAVLLAFAGAGLLLLVGLGIAILMSGGAALLLLFKLGKLLVFLAIPLWFLVKSAMSALLVRLPAPQGRALRRAEAPALFAALDRVRRTMRGPRFHHVLLVDEMNAAVVQRPLFGLVGFPRNYLLLGLPLLEATRPDEALAVVAHEYGHLAGSHGRFGAFIYRLRNTWAAIQAIAEQWSGWAGRLLRRPVRWYAPYFNAYTFVLARANEYQADAAARDLVGREAAASALKRVNVSGASYERFLQLTCEGAKASFAPPPDIAEQWASRAAGPADADLAQQFLADALARESTVWDTHPSLRQRLQALGVPDEALSVLPAPLAQASAAEAWLGATAADVRQAFQQRWRDRVADGWRAQFEQWEQRRQRLAALQAQPERDSAEALEALRLRWQLHREDDLRSDAADFNQRHPDHAGGLFLEGVLRLDRDDEDGLALLERAMALDDDAIAPGCQQAYQFLAGRGDARATGYGERWQQRAAWEELRATQLQSLDPDGELRDPALSEADRERLRGLVRAASRHIARAWIARRVLPADPELPTYVVVVRLRAWARWRGRQAQVVQALAQQDWPLHAFFTAGDGRYVSLGRRIRTVAHAAL